MQSLFEDILGKENVFLNEPMKKHTTFHIGGGADYFLEITDETALLKVIKICREKNLPVFVLGNGSNLLVGDGGIRGVVLHFKKNFSSVRVSENKIYAQSGALLSKIAAEAANNSLSGFEAVSGIPGTLGGAVYMNAGAYGFEVSGCIKKIKYLDEDLSIKEAEKEKCGFSYRRSMFTGTGKVILSAEFEFEYGEKEKIKELMAEYTKKRVSKQPLEKFSAGSTFKRPEGYFAGALIEGAELKGTKVGDAEVSEKHAGFVVNNKNASAKEVLELIRLVQKRVYEKYKVKLEPEVKLIGEFEDR